jgi:hypothetical protein
MKRET